MVKLEVNNPVYKHEVFYFRTMKECDEFLYVFRDHMCNVPWMKPVESPDFPEMTSSDRKYMMSPKSPREKAESNLSWGFSLVQSLDIGLTAEQRGIIRDIMALTANGG